MPRRKPPACILILQDVGSNMNELTRHGEVCLNLSKNCILQIMLRKLHSESQDEFSLITYGSETTKNKLANGNEYRGIEVKTDHFSVVNREVLTEVENLQANPNGTGDWLDAIVVAIQFISEESQIKPYSELKIVLFSNLHSPVNDNEVNKITRQLKEMEIDLTIIGPDVPADCSTQELTSNSIKQGEILAASMIGELKGTLCSFKDAYTELENLQRKSAKPTPWNSMLVISTKIKIPIRAFKKIAKPKPYKWIVGTIDDETAAVQKERAFVKYDETNETEVEVSREELIDAYLFGTTIIPFSDIDKDSMTYKSGSKGLYLIGCTKRDSVPQNILMGDGSYIVLARQDDQVGNHMLQSFIQAMYDNDIVGIARRVYTDNSSAYLGALFPYVTEDSRYLVYTQLPFAEDEHVYKFASLEKTLLSDDELKAADNLLDAMDLDQIDSDDEMYDLTRTYDPHEQYKLRCFGYKYMHPDKDISEEIKSDIIRAMQPKSIVIERSKEALEKIKEKFPLEKVIKRTKGKFNRNYVNNDSLNSDTKTSTLFQKATIKSDDDMNVVNPSSSDEYQKIQHSIESMITTNSDSIDEFIDMLKSLRKYYSNKDPKAYNEWISRIKILIQEQNLLNFWKATVDEKLGLIIKSESPLVDIDEQVGDEFYKAGKHDEEDSMYGSLNTDIDNDNWLDDL